MLRKLLERPSKLTVPASSKNQQPSPGERTLQVTASPDRELEDAVFGPLRTPSPSFLVSSKHAGLIAKTSDFSGVLFKRHADKTNPPKEPKTQSDREFTYTGPMQLSPFNPHIERKKATP